MQILFTNLIWFLLVYLGKAQDISFGAGSPTYTLVAPVTLRPNLDYHVSASLHDVHSAVEFTVTIAGLSDAGNFNSVTRTAVIQPRETQILKFEIGQWGTGSYNISVNGRGGISFYNETGLKYEHKSYSVFIQTDKAIYKPGQTVLFRVIVVNPYLNPAVTGAIDIHVTDAAGNRIKQWERILTTRGIVGSEFQLSDQPVLGDWKIHVNVLNQLFEKSFTVAEYVLPTFEVIVDLPKYATYNKSDAVATVRAIYTYGKPVKGHVTLTVAPRTRYNFVSVRPLEPHQVKREINGSVDIPINIRDALNLKTDFFEREIEFYALVEEELTGRKYNTTNTMMIYDKEIKVELIKTAETFKPGLKYTAFLKVAYQDDTPASDPVNPLKLRYGYSYNEEKWETVQHWVPTNGIIKLEFFPPPGDGAPILAMQAEYKGQIHYIEGIDAAMSPSNNFIHVLLLTKDPVVGQAVEFEANATEPMTHLSFQVTARGDIVFAQTVAVQNQSSYRFSFIASYRMAPQARVVAYYVRAENNEIVADAVNFEVSGTFRTPVLVDANPKNVKPAAVVDVTVQTKPNALVCVLGLDQSILLLKSGNDITQNDVIEDLKSYDSGKKNKQWLPWGREKRSLWWPGSSTAGEIFDDSGMVILSNGLVNRFEQFVRFRENAIYLNEKPITAPLQPPVGLPEGPEKDAGFTILRKHFPETWLWSNATAGYDGKAVFSSVIPDTITSWVISAFSIDSVSGLGIAPTTAKVQVFRPFFIKLNLPYSVIRGESLSIQAVVFNYNSKPIQAEVTLENSKGEFDFTNAGNEAQNSGKKSKIISVPAEDGASAFFLITPKKLGYITIKVSAAGPLTGDTVLKKLLVKAEGTPQYFNNPVLIDLRNPASSPIKANISVEIPSNAVPGSERITVSAIGDLLGPTITHLDKLLKIPFGCGEQNMLNFVPNIVVLEYLTQANRVVPEFRNKAIKNMENGYQRELTYKRDDGSFSAFGNRDSNGSTWLTSFVVKSFHQARPYIDIDPDVLSKAIEWLVKQQRSDGSFNEPGEVHHKSMQSGSGGGAALTAYVLISLLENEAQRNYTSEVSSAERFLAEHIQFSNDPYFIAVASYALHLSGSRLRESAFQILMRHSRLATGGRMYWTTSTGSTNNTGKQSDYYFIPSSQDVEMTSYALMTLLLRGDVNGALPIMRWLISQQNENGGFASTQDTVIGIQALGRMASRIASNTVSIDVNLHNPEVQAKNIRISGNNAMLYQSVEFPKNARYIEIEAVGVGIAVVQVSWVFNLAVSGEAPAFYLHPQLDKTSTENYLQLSICTNYKGESESNMAVMEVSLPSGYLADVDALPSIHKTKQVKRVESVEGDTNVVIYFDRISRKELCVTVPAHRTFKVANQKPVPVKVYDYYDLSKSARMFYHSQEATLCDICVENDCGNACENQVEGTNTNQVELGSGNGNNSASHISGLYSLLTVLFVVLFVRW